MSKSKSLTQAKTDFLEYYCSLLPEYTPESLDKYLSIRNHPVILVSPLFEQEVKKSWTSHHLSYKPLSWFPFAVTWPKEAQIGTSLPGFSEGWIYALNPSSLLPVIALLKDTHLSDSPSILDASAAPGGKSLAILNMLLSQVPRPNLIANDVSLPRYKRLRTVLKNYGFPEIVTTHFPIQALKYHFAKPFDLILLDAPCSSEKHVFNSKKHLKIWSPNRSKNLQHLQLLLIESLIPLLKTDGKLVYSTCSISPHENQEVISNIISNHSSLTQISISNHSIPGYDPSTWDPMFVATISQSPTPTLLSHQLS